MTGGGQKAANKHLGGVKHPMKKYLEVKEEVIGTKKRLHDGGNDQPEFKRRKIEDATPKESI